MSVKSKYINLLKNNAHTDYIVHFADFECLFYDKSYRICCYSIYDSVFNCFKTESLLLNIDHIDLIKSSENLVSLFLEDVFKCGYSRTKKTIFYFHNLSKFDGLFILKELAKNLKYTSEIINRDNQIYQIKVKFNDQEIFFRDSFLLYPSSLSNFAELFSTSSKLAFDHDNHFIENYQDINFIVKLKLYCENDVFILKTCFNDYNAIILKHFNVNLMDSLTLSSLALKIFRKHYYTSTLICKSEGLMDSFIRRSYRGGIAEVYKPIVENGFYYDINSLYPYIMMTSEMPVGDYEYLSVINDNFDIQNFFGFIEVEVVTPNNLYIPYLSTYSSTNSLISPLGTWKDVYFSEEIKYALTLGYTFKYIKGYSFKKKEIVFDKYVTTLYQMRLNFKNTSLNKIIKLLLNSLYGRFGMNFNIKNTIIIDKNDKKKIAYYDLFYDANFHFFENSVLIKYSPQPDLNFIQANVDEIDKNLYHQLLNESFKNRQNFNVAVHIASAITAYSRIYVHKIKTKYKDNLIYSDTDSFVFNKEIDSKLISNTEIGLLKFEGRIKFGLFLAPKLYFMDLEGKDILKIKGINTKKIDKQYFLDLYHNSALLEPIMVENNFFRDYKKLTISKKNTYVKLTAGFHKRTKLFKNEQWVDTHPLVHKTILSLEKNKQPFYKHLWDFLKSLYQFILS